MSERTTPVGIRQAGGDQLEIDWQDGHRSRYRVRDLRIACRCARCIEELTGRPLLKDEDVAADVRPRRIAPVGRYAIQISWSDGHDSGIYTFEYLRELGGSDREGASAPLKGA